MKRLALGLAAGALALSAAPSAGAAEELPKPGVRTQWCGTTAMTPCGWCVTLDRADLACTS